MSSCRFSLGLRCLSAGLLLLSAGCNSEKPSKADEVELPTWLTENDADSAGNSSVQLASDTPSAQLALNLKVGDQFPLRKVVQQELSQSSLSGEPKKSYSRLELMMAISVREKQLDRTKLSVRYDSVKYRHDVADEHIEFDSSKPGKMNSVGVIAYRDMVDDGFSFWIGADNQIVGVEGLAEFISRCLRNVPPEHRQDVVLGIESGSGETGIANFVDNTIGLLPYGRRTSPGDSWERQQQIGRPVPMHISNVYTLKELTDQLAVIDVRGTITPSTTLQGVRDQSGVSVMVNGGSTLGSCVIYRDTGLPRESRVDRIVDMTVTMENSVNFRQTKRVTTIVESFPATPSQLPQNLNAGETNSGAIQQVSGEYPAR